MRGEQNRDTERGEQHHDQGWVGEDEAQQNRDRERRAGPRPGLGSRRLGEEHRDRDRRAAPRQRQARSTTTRAGFEKMRRAAPPQRQASSTATETGDQGWVRSRR
ncbi:uncharacterized protein DS421_2g47100 [Arachis hypogaea]|nr:uncharacterized protein DS421_2g47100 [Arachis hypogaea]